eukprot:g693.t1
MGTFKPWVPPEVKAPEKLYYRGFRRRMSPGRAVHMKLGPRKRSKVHCREQAAEYYDRDLVHAGLTGTTTNVTIESFSYGGCFSADVALGALGSNYSTFSVSISSPSQCADLCSDREAFLVGLAECICVKVRCSVGRTPRNTCLDSYTKR